jgi:hypothetical protein
LVFCAECAPAARRLAAAGGDRRVLQGEAPGEAHGEGAVEEENEKEDVAVAAAASAAAAADKEEWSAVLCASERRWHAERGVNIRR